MASINDLITGVTSGGRPTATTLASQKAESAPSISCDSLSDWETDTAVHFAIYLKDNDGNKISSTQTDWKGIVSGNSITNLTLTAGVDQVYPVGATIECMPTAAWADELAQALLVSLTTQGAIKAGAISNSNMFGSGVVVPAKWANPYKFRAYAAIDQTGVGGFTTVNLANEDFDTNNNFAANTYTAPVSGFYQVNGSLHVRSSVTGAIIGWGIQVLKNGTDVVITRQPVFDNNWSVDVAPAGLSDIIQLSAGDTIVLQGSVAVSSGTGALKAGVGTSFSGFLVSQT